MVDLLLGPCERRRCPVVDCDECIDVLLQLLKRAQTRKREAARRGRRGAAPAHGTVERRARRDRRYGLEGIVSKRRGSPGLFVCRGDGSIRLRQRAIAATGWITGWPVKTEKGPPPIGEAAKTDSRHGATGRSRGDGELTGRRAARSSSLCAQFNIHLEGGTPSAENSSARRPYGRAERGHRGASFEVCVPGLHRQHQLFAWVTK